MTDSFEIKKNTKAFTYTIIICAIILAIAIFYTWPLQVTPVAVAQDLIEINLGNDMEGRGDVQPLVKGNRAPDVKPVRVQEKNVSVKEESSGNIKADENADPEAAPVTQPLKTNPAAKNIDKEAITKQVKNTNITQVVAALPAPQKPKLPLYKGGNGTGGNNASQDNGYRNQGYKTGNGDAGNPDGKPDSYGSSPGGRSGVSIVRGLQGRRPIHFPSMEDEFNENAKVYVDITVDASGIVTGASIAKGTTTSDSALRSIALQKARQLKFPPGQSDEEAGTILFNFILKS